MAPVDEEVDGFVLISHGDGAIKDGRLIDAGPSNVLSELRYLNDISEAVDSLDEVFWPINKKIHDNPERGFKEFIAHDALTGFMKSQRGWVVTPSAYGMDTAWVAVYDTGRRGPVVSFNAEMGKSSMLEAEQIPILTFTFCRRLSPRHWPCMRP